MIKIVFGTLDDIEDGEYSFSDLTQYHKNKVIDFFKSVILGLNDRDYDFFKSQELTDDKINLIKEKIKHEAQWNLCGIDYEHFYFVVFSEKELKSFLEEQIDYHRKQSPSDYQISNVRLLEKELGWEQKSFSGLDYFEFQQYFWDLIKAEAILRKDKAI